jgi:mRNA-degrading endonuclease RelE of RelBE toxin-antitoxin system
VSYAIIWERRAANELTALARSNPSMGRRVIRGIERFAASGLGDVKRLTGEDSLRLRVGDWRVIFSYDADGSSIIILRVLPRGPRLPSLSGPELRIRTSRY